jgi:hypothetical protein
LGRVYYLKRKRFAIRLLIFDPLKDKERVHLLKNLEHFLSSFLGSKEFYAALIGAVIGGLLTGRFALRAQKQAAEDQRRSERESEQRAIEGTLKAIAAELKVLKADSFDPLDKRLKEQARIREEFRKNNLGTPVPLAMTRTEQNRLTVFESNANMLGRVNDDELRKKIVRVYGLIKGLLDHLNAMARDFERWRSFPDTHPEKQIVASMYVGLEDGLRNGLDDLQRELGELLPQIEKFLDH